MAVVDAIPRKKTRTDGMKTNKPWRTPASRGFLQYRARSGWLTSIGDRLPKMVLIPAMMDQPKGVTEADSVLGSEAMSMLSPPPILMQTPKRAKAATGMVKPLTVKR